MSDTTICGFCGKTVTLKKSGGIRQHTKKPGTMCPGTGLTPGITCRWEWRGNRQVMVGYCTICGVRMINLTDSRSFMLNACKDGGRHE